MANNPVSLIDGWHIENPCEFATAVLVSTLALRVILSSLRGAEYYYRHRGAYSPPLSRVLWLSIKGYGLDIENYDDLWMPTILGTLELLVLPVLLATGHETYVGAWVGLKVVAVATSW